MEHLTPQTWRAAVGGDRALATQLAQHLAMACDECERFIAEAPELEYLNGEVDRILLTAASPSQEPLHDRGYRRVMRELRPSRLRGVMAAGLGMAASLLMVAGLSFGRQELSTGLKGTPSRWVELSAVAQSPDGALRALADGDEVSSEDVLLVRDRSSDPLDALLVQQGPESEAEPLGVFKLEPGVHDLRRQDALAGVSLGGREGPVTLWLMTSAGPAPTLAAARAVLRGSGDGAVSGTPFHVSVETRHH
jgi:hypothetical protein